MKAPHYCTGCGKRCTGGEAPGNPELSAVDQLGRRAALGGDDALSQAIEAAAYRLWIKAGRRGFRRSIIGYRVAALITLRRLAGGCGAPAAVCGAAGRCHAAAPPGAVLVGQDLLAVALAGRLVALAGWLAGAGEGWFTGGGCDEAWVGMVGPPPEDALPAPRDLIPARMTNGPNAAVAPLRERPVIVS